MNKISIICNGRLYEIPNRWESVSPKAYQRLVGNLMAMARGKQSPGEVRLRLLCDLMDWEPSRIHDDDSLATLIALSERLTFLFNVDSEGRYMVDLCFCAQLVPTLYAGGRYYEGYSAQLSYGQISIGLTALQFIEAREVLSQGEQSLPLLAAILYAGRRCESEEVQRLADGFARLPEETLTAVAWNFQAINNFLFSRTSLSLLTKFKHEEPSALTTDAADALYDLCADGLGNNREVEQMNVITYLRILRKKTIDTVRQMRDLKMDTPTIAHETGLPLEVVNGLVN